MAAAAASRLSACCGEDGSTLGTLARNGGFPGFELPVPRVAAGDLARRSQLITRRDRPLAVHRRPGQVRWTKSWLLMCAQRPTPARETPNSPDVHHNAEGRRTQRRVPQLDHLTRRPLACTRKMVAAQVRCQLTKRCGRVAHPTRHDLPRATTADARLCAALLRGHKRARAPGVGAPSRRRQVMRHLHSQRVRTMRCGRARER